MTTAVTKPILPNVKAKLEPDPTPSKDGFTPNTSPVV